MGRLQDFPSVTPTSSDNILIVQSQGQGLASVGSTLGAKMDKANPTGTGTVSFNRRSGTTEGTRSFTEGSNCTASGNYSHAEGAVTTASGEASHSEGGTTTASGVYSHAEGAATTASGQTSHAEGYGTEANHRSQHVFGEWNTLDASTAASTAKGNYIEIVGKGTSNGNRSNARTLDWNGNEELAGDLTYNGNVSLTSLLNQYFFKSGTPAVISGLSRYETFIVMGFAQSIGTVVIMVTISAGTLDTPINMKTGQAFSNSHLTFTYSSSGNSLTIASDNSSESRITVIRG